MEFRRAKSKAVPPTTRREFLRKAAAGVVLLPTPWFSHAAAEQSVTRERVVKPLHWQTHGVGKIPTGYQVVVADVKGDGRPTSWR